MRFTALTRDVEIGANCYLIEVGDKRLVIDSGTHPRQEGADGLPNFRFLRDQPLDAIILTHAHMDHVGSLPMLQRRFPHAPVFMSQPTMLLAETMLHNSVNVMTKKREELDINLYPFFTHREVEASTGSWLPCPLNQPMSLRGERLQQRDSQREPVFTFFDGGHILGSVAVLIEYRGQRLLYTGDIQLEDQDICRAAELPTENIDVLIVETTRGSAARAPHYSREAEAARLAECIREVFDRGGAVLIPLFALGRTQEMLTLFNHLQQRRDLPRCPIFIGGLGSKMTTIYDKLSYSAHRQKPKFNIMEETRPEIANGRTIWRMRPKPKHLYGISSGMMTENTLSNLFARHIIDRPEHGLFFVGYSDPASPAGKIRAARHGDEIQLSPDTKPLPLRCQIEEFDFSAHAPRKAILDYICAVRARKTLLVHGDEPAIQWFEEQLAELLPELEVITPKPGVTENLD